MNGIIQLLTVLAGLLAAAAVAVGCGVGLIVWLAGGRRDDATEAWPPSDER